MAAMGQQPATGDAPPARPIIAGRYVVLILIMFGVIALAIAQGALAPNIGAH